MVLEDQFEKMEFPPLLIAVTTQDGVLTQIEHKGTENQELQKSVMDRQTEPIPDELGNLHLINATPKPLGWTIVQQLIVAIVEPSQLIPIATEV